jgi:hypothetical protein
VERGRGRRNEKSKLRLKKDNIIMKNLNNNHGDEQSELKLEKNGKIIQNLNMYISLNSSNNDNNGDDNDNSADKDNANNISVSTNEDSRINVSPIIDKNLTEKVDIFMEETAVISNIDNNNDNNDNNDNDDNDSNDYYENDKSSNIKNCKNHLKKLDDCLDEKAIYKAYLKGDQMPQVD